MLTTRDEIHIVNDSIKRKKQEISLIDPSDPNNRFKYANAKSELNMLISKLDSLSKRLQEEYKSDSYVPVRGDERYQDYPNKASLDELRIKHFNLFNVDPLITYYGNGPMFDESLYAYSDFYGVKGTIPFKLAYSSFDPRLVNDPRATIGIKISKKEFEKSNDKQIDFLRSIIKEYTDGDINLVLTDALIQDIIIAHISRKEFNFTVKKEKDYYYFFKELCNSMSRNIVFIGDSMKDGVNTQSIFDVQTGFINPGKKTIAKLNNTSEEKIEEVNESIRKKVLRLT